MKNILLLLIIFTFTVSAQESIKPQFEKEGGLTKVIFFHDNGVKAQTGYLKDNNRHGNWISYNRSGKKVSMGSFQSDLKNGQWFFWNENELIEVIYLDNKIVNVLEWNNSENKLIAKND